MHSLLKRLLRNRNGAVAIEYALIAGIVSIVIVIGVRTVGTEAQALYQYIATNLTSAPAE
jgi:pilus assembly protein Flp/PilA